MNTLVLLLLSQTSIVTTTGYVDSRTTGAWTQFDGAPALTELGEANAQIKLTPHEKVTFFADASLFWQAAWLLDRGGQPRGVRGGGRRERPAARRRRPDRKSVV